MADPFHLNADYMKGVLYEGRRQFLNSDGGEDSLKPPLEFMTKKQARSTLKIQRDNATKTVDFNHILVIKTNKKEEPDEESSTKHQKHVADKEKKRTTKNKRQAMIVIEEFSSTRPEDWSEQKKAGVNTWVNHNTGEVSGICPWKAYTHENDDEKEESIEFAGTGSIVYDNSEFEEFLNMLDTTAAKEKMKK